MMEQSKPAHKQLPAALSNPKKLLTKYEDFVTDNSSSISQVESALRSLTYIIPGRFPFDAILLWTKLTLLFFCF